MQFKNELNGFLKASGTIPQLKITIRRYVRGNLKVETWSRCLLEPMWSTVLYFNWILRRTTVINFYCYLLLLVVSVQLSAVSETRIFHRCWKNTLSLPLMVLIPLRFDHIVCTCRMGKLALWRERVKFYLCHFTYLLVCIIKVVYSVPTFAVSVKTETAKCDI